MNVIYILIVYAVVFILTMLFKYMQLRKIKSNVIKATLSDHVMLYILLYGAQTVYFDLSFGFINKILHSTMQWHSEYDDDVYR